MAVDEPEGDPHRGEEKLNSPKTYLHVRLYPEQHVRSYADTVAVDRFHCCHDVVECADFGSAHDSGCGLVRRARQSARSAESPSDRRSVAVPGQERASRA